MTSLRARWLENAGDEKLYIEVYCTLARQLISAIVAQVSHSLELETPSLRKPDYLGVVSSAIPHDESE